MPKRKATSFDEAAQESSSSQLPRRRWLFKSEPSEFSIDALMEKGTSPWDGVRNAQAKNFMRQMQVGDVGFFYHSNAGKETGIIGVVEVVRSAYPDSSAFDSQSKYYDPRSSEDKPKWYMVDVKGIEKWKAPVLLQDLKSYKYDAEKGEPHPGPLHSMVLLHNTRLSIQPISDNEWEFITALNARG